MLVSDFIATIRGRLGDPNSVIWADAELLPLIGAGMNKLMVHCPETRLDGNARLLDVYSGTPATTDVVAIPDGYLQALEAFVLMRAFESDRGDQADDVQAEKYRELWNKYTGLLG